MKFLVFMIMLIIVESIYDHSKMYFIDIMLSSPINIRFSSDLSKIYY